MVDLELKANCKMLMLPKLIENKVNLNVHTYLVKQMSDKWFELRKQALTMGSTIYKLVGLDALKRQKEHFNEFALGLEQPVAKPDILQHRQHCSDKEVNVIGILVSIFMPAMFPQCAKYTDDGVNFIHGNIRQ